MIRTLRNVAEAAPVLCACLVFSVLPRRVALYVGRRLGGVAYYLSPRSRKVALDNLQTVLKSSAAQARRTTRLSLRHCGAAFVDLFRSLRVNPDSAMKQVEIPDDVLETLREIKRNGRGAVFIGSHYGRWEFMNLAAPFLNLPPILVVARPIANPILNRLLSWARKRTGQHVIHRFGAALECLHWVRDGGICGIPFDLPVPPDAGAVPVDFFGLETYTTIVPGYVAAMAEAPAYFVYLEPLKKGRSRLMLKGPLDAPFRGSLRQTAIETTRRMSTALEEVIRARPEAWAWWMKRWKIRPKGIAKGEYPAYSTRVDYYWGPEGRRVRDRGTG